MVMRQLFVWNERSGEARGPFELETVEELYEAGVLESQTLVAARGESLWTCLSEHAYTAPWFDGASSNPSRGAIDSAEADFYARAQRMQDSHKPQGPIHHAAYDPDYELELLDLNSGSRRRLRDFVLLVGGLNIALAVAFFMLPFNPITATILLSGFVAGNMSLSWIFGLVLRY